MNTATMNADDFINMIKNAKDFTNPKSYDERIRYIKLHFEEEEVVATATEGHMISIETYPASAANTFDCCVTADVIKHFPKDGYVQIELDNSYVTVMNNSTRFLIEQPTETYDPTKFINGVKNDDVVASIRVNSKLLINALRGSKTIGLNGGLVDIEFRTVDAALVIKNAEKPSNEKYVLPISWNNAASPLD